MSVKEVQPSQIIRTAAEIGAASFLAAVPGIAYVTAKYHREDTHHSLKLDPALIEAGDREMAIYAPKPKIWPSVHRLHHHFPDTNLYPIWKTAQAITQASGIETRNEFPYLDRFATIPKDEVVHIGDLADQYLRDRMGGHYVDPQRYSKDQLHVLLDPRAPRYLYPLKKHVGEEYTPEEMAMILLRDPHSPALMARQNGVQGVLFNNVDLYRGASYLFRYYPELMPEDLRDLEVVDHKFTRVNAFIEQSLAMTDLVMKFKGYDATDPEDLLKALLEGVAITTVKTGFHIAGGNITNSLGHAGETTPISFLKAIFAKNYVIMLNENGKISSNARAGGIFAGPTGFISFGEVNGQDDHHLYPELIAYTQETGLKAWYDQPWGKFLEYLAYNPDVPWINPGEGFDLEPGEVRPDMPHQGVEIIEGLRAAQRESRRRRRILQAA